LKTSVSYKQVWEIAYPIIVGSVAQNVLNVTDTAFLGRLGEVGLGAGAFGGLFYLAIIMLGWGFGIGTQIIVARRFGEGVFRPIGRTIEHAQVFLLLLAFVLVFLVMVFGRDLMVTIIESGNVLEASVTFLNYRIWGLFFAFTHFSFRAFYVGIGRTRVITGTTILMVLVNVFLDYSLIFGHFGFPRMGIAGAALASTIAEISCTVAFIVFTLYKVDVKKYRLFNYRHFSAKLYVRMFKVSVPLMLQNFFSFAIWFLFFLIIEKMGETALAVSNIIRSVYVVMLIPIMGFASATNTLVSFLIGQGRSNEVIPLIRRIAMLCMGAVLMLSTICMLFPHAVLLVYTNDPILLAASKPVLYIVAIAAIFLASALVIFNGVSGTGRTGISFAIESVILIFYLLFSYFVALVIDLPLAVVWSVEIFYGIFLSIISFIYLKSNRWVGKGV